ncbi:hypothetical protein AB4Y45_43300 [Paraburkholderia sp. EG287A]|uniref:Uncharacterized protein n=2 Tax=Paraburkholderia TaxID=1822464 RepID=B2JXP2_PARP8|nr:hypothetical protein [Paraburkholderia caribensis]ACC76400.1 hypothetical protein Bphy_7440 [Paraburkholderia phymatum STM815]MCO4882861.1 hypothetical protein [Paraburkholderia caribensis]
MSKVNPAKPDGLSASDWEILAQGLNALLRERTVAYQIAVSIAVARGFVRPEVGDFGLPDILRLSRAI